MTTTVNTAHGGFNTQHPNTAAPSRWIRPGRSVHHVKPGESLGSIAHTYGMSEGELIQNNSHTLGSNGLVHAGMRLEVGLYEEPSEA